MGRLPRLATQPRAGFEIVNRAHQGRYLIKPSLELNSRIVGALAKARERYPVDIYCGAFLSSHFHLYLSAENQAMRAGFMRELTRKLSIESGHLYDWQGSTFPHRYHAIEVSNEPEAQIARLTYHLRQGCKEGLSASPFEWPGVPFAEALVGGEPLQGQWIDRTGYYRARKRGEDVSLKEFTEDVELPLAPLPCWRHLDASTRRNQILGIIRRIEEETAAMHQEQGTAPLGAEAVLAADPHFRPNRLEKSPKPLVHAFRRKVRSRLREALAQILAAYQAAAEKLRTGDRLASFPANTFPPALPFVQEATSSLLEPD